MSAGRAIAMIWAAVPRELGCEAVSDGPFEISATVPAGTAILDRVTPDRENRLILQNCSTHPYPSKF